MAYQKYLINSFLSLSLTDCSFLKCCLSNQRLSSRSGSIQCRGWRLRSSKSRTGWGWYDLWPFPRRFPRWV